MAISARNQLKGKVTEVILGNVMAHITISCRPERDRFRDHTQEC